MFSYSQTFKSWKDILISSHGFRLKLCICFYMENTTCAAVLHNLEWLRSP